MSLKGIPGDSAIENLPVLQEMQIWFLGQEDPMVKEMVTHFSILAWKIPWTEEAGKLQSVVLQRVGHNWASKTFTLVPYIIKSRLNSNSVT